MRAAARQRDCFRAPQQEIAKEVGYKVPSAVSKRIEKIAEQFEAFVGKEYGEFLDRHVK